MNIEGIPTAISRSGGIQSLRSRHCLLSPLSFRICFFDERVGSVLEEFDYFYISVYGPLHALLLYTPFERTIVGFLVSPLLHSPILFDDDSPNRSG